MIIIITSILLSITIIYHLIRQNKKYKLSSVIYKPKYFDFPRQHQDNPKGLKSPLDLGIKYNDIQIVTEDGINLHGWYLPNYHQSHFPTIIYFQEEYGNLGTKLYFLQYYLKIVQANIFIFSYRGFGLSQGSPSKSGLLKDTRAIIKYVIERNEGKGLYIHGRQLGANLALEITYEFQNQIDGIILDNIVVKSSDLVKKYLNIEYEENWDADNLIHKAKTKSLFIISENNEISTAETQNLFYETIQQTTQKVNIPSQQYFVQQSTLDNNWCIKPFDYFERISQFIQIK